MVVYMSVVHIGESSVDLATALDQVRLHLTNAANGIL